MKKLFYDISIVRMILIISIVIGHGFVIYLNGQTWPLPEGVTPSSTLKWINPIFISFQLQAFVMISGYLFASQQETKKMPVGSFILKKAKRILLPCLLFGVLYYFLIIYNGERLDVVKFALLICKGAGHLWFLPMIFCCYVAGRLIDKVLGRYKWIYSWFVLIPLFCVSMCAMFVPSVWCIPNAIFYYVFFHLGQILYRHKGFVIGNWCNIKTLIPLWVASVAMIGVYAYGIVTGEIHWLVIRVLRILLGIVCSTTLWLTVNYFVNKGEIANRQCVKNILSWNGWYGIYIVHQFILKYAYYQTGISLSLGSWLPWICVMVTLVLSYAITTMLLKTKYGRYLIG